MRLNLVRYQRNENKSYDMDAINWIACAQVVYAISVPYPGRDETRRETRNVCRSKEWEDIRVLQAIPDGRFPLESLREAITE